MRVVLFTLCVCGLGTIFPGTAADKPHALAGNSRKARLHAVLREACPQWATRYEDLAKQLENLRPEPPHKHSANQSLVVDVAVTAIMEVDQSVPWGQLRNLRVVVLSALFATDARVRLHVQTTRDSYAAVEGLLLELRRTAAFDFCFRLYCVDLERLEAEAHAKGLTMPSALFARTLLPLQLADLERVLVLDTDTVVLSDLALLWHSAEKWPATAVMGMSRNWGGPGAGSHNSGVLLIELRKLLGTGWVGHSGWMDTVWRTLLSSQEYQVARSRATVEGKVKGGHWQYAFGFVEQKVFSWVGGSRPGGIVTLDPAWNVEMCDGGNRRIASFGGPGKRTAHILHMNCMKSTHDGCADPAASKRSHLSAPRPKNLKPHVLALIVSACTRAHTPLLQRTIRLS